ncbi:hypothetical protein SLEP1_g14114 [Rubroshorea leprosula]|uniref:Uncharacterized protein n=1 Tax=Rubroshorea leprosula TaxID=152421 RepID=A0AAV5IHY9_9ROSI|nr:hypothetical protein SLEP1_g14114 [Rubroshorea leprosula]
MRSSLKVRKLWWYIIGDITLPQKVADEIDKNLDGMKQLRKCGICLQKESTFNDIADIGKYIEYCDKMRSNLWKTQSKPDQSSKPVVAAAIANQDTSVHPSIGNLETLFRQMISSSSTSTAMLTILGSTDGIDSWDRS